LPAGVEIYAKAEHLNPGGSVKDRAAMAMILAGEQSGKLTKGKTILDATSGNTGIAYAMIGAARGYAVTLCLPSNASIERKRILRIYGAEIIETDAMNGTDGAQIKAKELVKNFPTNIFTPTNTTTKRIGEAHYDQSAAEIWRETNGRITHLSPVSEQADFRRNNQKIKRI
jgi:cysteine synthase B